jgi:ribosomal-protein-alanine N-acetyltransferase
MLLPPYPHYPVLKGERLVLRALAASDADHFFEIATFEGKPVQSHEEVLPLIQKIEAAYQEGQGINWCIADAKTDELLGTCGFYRGFAGEAAEVGCILKPAHRCKGLMQEALELVCSYGLQAMKLRRIFAITTAGNVKARALLGRMGFREVSASAGDELEYELFPAPIGN